MINYSEHESEEVRTFPRARNFVGILYFHLFREILAHNYIMLQTVMKNRTWAATGQYHRLSKGYISGKVSSSHPCTTAESKQLMSVYLEKYLHATDSDPRKFHYDTKCKWLWQRTELWNYIIMNVERTTVYFHGYGIHFKAHQNNQQGSLIVLGSTPA